MKIVLGMAKSGKNTKGARGPKIELDFLRLLFAIRNVEEVKKCYLVVQNTEVKRTVKAWEKKYGMKEGEVETIAAELSDKEKRDLDEEKEENKQGVIDSMTGGNNEGKSKASLGEKTLEVKLAEEIEKRLNTSNNYTKKILGINWDYSGIIK